MTALSFPKNVEELIIPSLQDIDFNLDRLKALNLPDAVTVDVVEFKGLEPVAPSKEVERIQFLYQDFTMLVQDVIDGKIAEIIYEVKPYDTGETEWGRAKEDLLEDREEVIESSFDEEASRGFIAPSGVFSKDISKQSLKVKKQIARANESAIFTQQNETLKNMADGLQAGNEAENVVRLRDQQKQTINLQAVQTLVDIDFRVFEVRLSNYNSKVEVKKIKRAAWVEELKGQLLILQEREIAIKGHTLTLLESTKQVEMFNLAIDYLNAQQALKEIELDNFVLNSELEKNKLLTFQSEVETFSSLINLNIAKFNLYKAGIDFEDSKIDKFKQEADVADAQLRTQNAKTLSGRTQANTKLDIAEAKLRVQAEKLRTAKTKLDTALIEGRFKAEGFSSDLLFYQAELRDWFTANSHEVLQDISEQEEVKDDSVNLIRNTRREESEIKTSTVEGKNVVDLANLNARIIEESATLTAKTEITSKLVHTLAGG